MDLDPIRNIDKYAEPNGAKMDLDLSIECHDARIEDPRNVAATSSNLIKRMYVSKGIVALVSFLFAYLLFIKSVEANSSHKIMSKRPPSEEEIAAAQGMESIFIGQMIEEMRKTIPDNELIPTSYAEKIYRSMLDVEYANIISRSGQFGIAEQVLAEIKGER